MKIGDSTKNLRQIDILDREERKILEERQPMPAWERRSRLSLPEYVGDTPTLAPGDVAGAKRFLDRVRNVLRTKGPFTRGERSKLHRYIKKWEPRANGSDKWFMAFGNTWGSRSK